MFEKEANKWVRENTHTEHSASFGEIKVEPSAEKGFQKGAEFGYNKANEWHDLEKAPNDLPSEAGGWVCNQDGLPCYFDWGTEQWLSCEGIQIKTTEWCNMPHKRRVNKNDR